MTANKEWASPTWEERENVARAALLRAHKELRPLSDENYDGNIPRIILRALWRVKQVEEEQDAAFAAKHKEESYAHGHQLDGLHIVATALHCIAMDDDISDYHPYCRLMQFMPYFAMAISAAQQFHEANLVLIDDDISCYVDASELAQLVKIK